MQSVAFRGNHADYQLARELADTVHDKADDGWFDGAPVKDWIATLLPE